MDMKKKLDKSIFKMTKEELDLWMHLRKAAFRKENKKGKGSYKRKFKHKNMAEQSSGSLSAS